MESNRNSSPLEEVIEKFIDYRGKTPEKTNQGIPLITAKIIKKGFIQEVHEFIAEKDYAKWMRRGIPAKNDVVLTTEAPLGEVAQIDTDGKIALAQRVITLRGKEGVLDNTFLKYSLQGPIMQQKLRERESGSTVTGIKSSELKKVIIEYPEIQVQKKIGTVLKNLDNKISLNNSIKMNLEQLAETLYKYWFVDFEFPNENGEPYKSSGGEMIDSELGIIPKGWKFNRLSEFASKMSNGGTPSRKESSYWENGDIPWIKTKEVKNNYIIKAEEFITNSGLTNSSAKLFKENTILIAMYGATAGQLGLLKIEAATNQACCGIDTEHPNFLYEYLLRNQKYIESLATGSAQQNLSKEIIGKLKILSPNIQILRAFESLLVDTSNYRELLIRENESLSALRDTLLPKLLSGEIEFPNETEVTEHVPIP